MRKIILLGVCSVLLSGFVVEPHIYAPSYPYDYVYNQPLRPYPPHRPRRTVRAVASDEQSEPDARIAEPRDDEAMRAPDMEEVIGGDDPPPDHPIRRSKQQP